MNLFKYLSNVNYKTLTNALNNLVVNKGTCFQSIDEIEMIEVRHRLNAFQILFVYFGKYRFLKSEDISKTHRDLPERLHRQQASQMVNNRDKSAFGR